MWRELLLLASSVILLLQAALADPSAYVQYELPKLLDLAKELTMQKNFKEVVDVYSVIIQKEPDVALHRYKRATINWSLGRVGSALEDFDSVIALNPDFEQAYSSRAAILMKQGRFQGAEADYKRVLQKTPGDESARQKLEEVKTALQEMEFGAHLVDAGNCDEAIGYLNKVMEKAPLYDKPRLLRAECFMKTGDADSAGVDLKYALHINGNNMEAYTKLAMLQFSIGDVKQCMENLKRCLHFDPEYKPCFNLRKKVKSIEKAEQQILTHMNGRNWNKAIAELEKALALVSPTDTYFLKTFNRNLCHSYLMLKKPNEAVRHCDITLKYDENDADALVDRAEANILREEFEAAVRDYSKAKDLKNDHKTHEGYQKAERLLKNSKNVDYYKVLGVSRTASQSEIKKAYRTLAQEWHPDKYKGDDEEKAQKMMAQINLAYEVLSDPELKAKYDAGEDPNDPQKNQGHPGGGFPFGGFQGGFPFGGGFPGGNFHFKFG